MKEEPEVLSDKVRDLLRRQTQLLEEQNKVILELSAKKNFSEEMLLPGEEVLVKDLWRDEIRDGFVVTSHKKRLWNIQLNLLAVIDRICKKHNIRWFAHYGTLLGAVRHKGFIPWDDDIDVVMFRPDYEKFKIVAYEELKNQPNYHAWYWFNYRLETDQLSENTDLSLPLISKEQADKYPSWSPLYPLIKILDTRTCYVICDDRKNVPCNVWADVFCLDPCPPFYNNTKAERIFTIARELFAATVLPERLREILENNRQALFLSETLPDILKLSYKQRAELFETFALENFSRTEYVGEIKHHCVTNLNRSHKFANFDDTIYLPFEKMELPCPVGYDNILKDIYGDWHKLVFTHSHAKLYSADISYQDYLKKVTLK